MRICILTRGTNRFGGMYRHSYDLVRGLVAAGHEVEVICPRQEGTPDAQGARWRMIEAPSDFASQTWQQASCAEFLRMHRERPVDVVHGEGSSALGLLRANAERHAPVVVMFHGNYVGLMKAAARRVRVNPRTILRETRGVIELSRRHFTRGNPTSFRRCEAIVPSHQQVADTCRSHHLDPAHVHVVPNGVDIRLWQPRPKETRERPLLVGSGRLSLEKGFHVALRALQRLPGRLLIAGRGGEEASLLRLASELGVADRLELLGPLPPEELASLIAQADVYLFPTLREEAAPLVLPEAMACGVPVIASRIGGIPEVIDRPGANGILVRAGSPPELADAVLRLLADNELRRSMGEAARARVLEEYTLEKMVERTVAVYELAAGGGAAASEVAEAA
jgi:glycosyltransferase involved in cell wall biosynthesis